MICLYALAVNAFFGVLCTGPRRPSPDPITSHSSPSCKLWVLAGIWWSDGQCVGDRCEKCTKSGRAPEENLVGLAGEQAFSSL
jgi:hypothetical protein